MYVHVKVTVGARGENVVETKPGYFEVSVREKAERNLANKKVLDLVAEHFQVPVHNVRIVNGHRHPSKLLVVEN